jgi:hypothetical protein
MATESSSSDSDTPRPLPELTGTLMDRAFLEQYFDDLAQCTEILAILPKMAPQAMSIDTAGWTLSDAKQGVMEGRVRGVQIRYGYDSAEWWDTLLCEPGGVRVVRIRQGA